MNKKKNLVLFSVFIFMLIYLLVSVSKYLNEVEIAINYRNDVVVNCQNVLNNLSEYSKEAIENCEIYLENFDDGYAGQNFFVAYSNILVDNLNSLCYILFFVVSFYSLIWICSKFKSKTFLNNYLREPNKKFIWRLFKESYPIIFAISLPMILFFTFLILNTNFTITNDLTNYSIWSISTMKMPVLFLILCIIRLICYLSTYVNITLLVARKNYNYIISIITSYLVFIFTELFIEIILRKLLFKFIPFRYFKLISLSNVFYFSDEFGIISAIVFPLILFIISSILVYLGYKDKEKVLIDAETNN